MSLEFGPEIGERIRKIRDSKNLSLDELGNLSGVTGRTIGCIERWDEDYRNPTLGTISAISSALGISSSLILYGKIVAPVLELSEPITTDKIGKLNEDEERLISNFRAIPTRIKVREQLLNTIESFAESFKKPAKK